MFSVGEYYSHKDWCGILTEHSSQWAITTIQWMETKNSTTLDDHELSAQFHRPKNEDYLMLVNLFCATVDNGHALEKQQKPLTGSLEFNSILNKC